MVLKNEILVEYASSKEMVADPLTKAATIESFKGHVRTVGVIEQLLYISNYLAKWEMLDCVAK